MPHIRPLRAHRYDLTQTGNPADLVAPSLELDELEAIDACRQRNPFNVMNLLAPSLDPDESSPGERFERAGQRLRTWLREGRLQRDVEPGYYVCEQSYAGESGRVTTRGFFGLLGLPDAYQPDGVLLPHARRGGGLWTPLLSQMALDAAPILTLYEDPAGQIDELLTKARSAFPDLAITDDAGTEHRLFPVANPYEVRRVGECLLEQTLLLGQGQPIYEAALSLYQSGQTERRAGYVLAFFVNAAQPSPCVRPVHRVLSGLDGFDFAGFLRSLRPPFAVEPVASLRDVDGIVRQLAEAGRDGPAFAVLGGGAVGRRSGVVIRLESAEGWARLGQAEPLEVVRRLDLTALNVLILRDRLGLDVVDDRPTRGVEYVADLAEAIQLGRSKSTQLVVLLNPPPLDAIRTALEQGGRLPWACLNFFPPLLRGLVFSDARNV